MEYGGAVRLEIVDHQRLTSCQARYCSHVVSEVARVRWAQNHAFMEYWRTAKRFIVHNAIVSLHTLMNAVWNNIISWLLFSSRVPCAIYGE